MELDEKVLIAFFNDGISNLIEYVEKKLKEGNEDV